MNNMELFKTDFFKDWDIHFYTAAGNIFFPTWQLTKPLGFSTEGQMGRALAENKIEVIEDYIGPPTFYTKDTLCQMIPLYQAERLVHATGIGNDFIEWAKQRVPPSFFHHRDTELKLKPAYCRLYKDIPVAFFRDENTGILYITDYNFALLLKKFDLAIQFKDSVLPEQFDRKKGQTPLADFVGENLFFSEYYVLCLLSYCDHIPAAADILVWLFKELQLYRQLYTVQVDFPPVTEHICEYFEKGSGIDKEKIYWMNKKEV